MKDRPVTASAVISFSQELEDSSSRFYQDLGVRFTECRDAFLGFARDGSKNELLITRTYQETISDALETGFSFQGLRLEDHLVELTLPIDISLAEALGMAIDLEEKAVAFYEEVAERSQSLLATIPGAFRRVAKRRRRRKAALEAMRG